MLYFTVRTWFFISRIFANTRQRATALVLVVMILFSVLYPSVAAYAVTHPPTRAPAPVPSSLPKTSTTPSIGNINYTSPPAPSTAFKSKYTAAADAGPLDYNSNTSTSFLDKTSRRLNNPLMTPVPSGEPTYSPHELVNARTATSSTFLNKDGTVTKTDYLAPHFYQNNSSWQTIDNTLVADNNAADSGNVFGQALGIIESWVSSPNAYKTQANDWEARFTPSDFAGGMVRVKMGNSQIGFSPVNANTVSPVITTDSNGQQTVHYYNLWNGVDVNYLVTSDKVSEAIVLKTKDANTQIQFKLIGAGLQKPSATKDNNTSQPAFNITGALNNQFGIAPADLILNNLGPIDSNTSGITQGYAGGTYTVGVSSSYVKALPDNAFPAVIDPDVEHFGNRAGGNYESFETTGYNCPSTQCDPYAGAVVSSNGSLQYWRSAFYVSYDQLRPGGQSLKDAVLHLTQRTGTNWWTGDTGSHTYQVGNATCLSGYGCMDGTWDSANIALSGDIDVKNIYTNLVNTNNWGGWLMLAGDDGADHSWKAFDPDNSYITFTYNVAIPSPTFAVPQNNQVFTDTQASFRANYESNPNNGTPLQYAFQITNSSNGGGVVVNSGNYQPSPNWTVPDGELQDGSTYYIEGSTYDSSTGLTSPWSAPMTFKIDTRKGKDKTQTYDTLGPINVDLATGNVETGITSHTTAALGGSIGVNLDYNSPLKSRPGLVGSYWNTTNGDGGTATSPDLRRTDQNVDFDWSSGTPGAPINSTYFAAQWNGYFVAPATGSYNFGGINDDTLTISVNGQQVYNNGGCSSGPCYGAGISLTAGQVVPFQANYSQITGSDYAHIYVSGAVSQQVVPTAWFQTGVRQTQQTQGLLGKYYTYSDTGNPPTFPSNGTDGLFLTRTDSTINFNWNNNVSPVSNGPTTDYMVRWTGFITLPATGSYTFGTASDDGSDITVNNQSVFSKWQDSPGTTAYGSPVSLNAGTYPITVDYYQHSGGAAMSLLVEPLGGASEVVPSSWLSPPQAKVLPAGWNLGVNPDGSVTYTHLSANQSNAILTDTSGDTYDYTWNGTGYTPPANAYGSLARNNDGTFTLQDSDGKTYVFDTAGNLTKFNNPVDDQHPAALQYTYGAVNGTGPVVIQRITDGINTNRYMNVYYSGASQCGSAPAGYALAPSNMVCAVQTNDNRTTYFYYTSSDSTIANLAMVAEPGNENTTYQYQSVANPDSSTVGYQLTGIRDALANDTVVAGIRADDEATYSQIGYDILGRAVSVTEPAATTGASQIENTIDYYTGATEEHVVGATEPVGYSKRVEYDNLFRTTKVYNNQGLTTTSVWDPVKDLSYSTTNPEGLTSTTVYDDEDRPVSTYGPAPSSWFNTWSWTLANGQSLTEGQSLYSPDHRFQFTFQTDGNVVLYGPSGAIWSSNTGGQTATLLAMQVDGNLVIYNGSTAIWASGTSGNGPTTYLAVQNDGNVNMYNSAGIVWSTGTGGWTPSPTPSTYGTPLSSYASQVARTDTAYDQGLTGLATAYMDVPVETTLNSASLTGAPLLHSTNIASDGTISKDWGTTQPIPNHTGNWGLSMTGTMRLPATGNWLIQLGSDEGMKMWIDGVSVIADWKDNTYWTGDTTKSAVLTDSYAFNNTVVNAVHTVRIDYYHITASSDANFSLLMTAPGGTQTSQVASYFSPDYGLTTSATTYDAALGNTTATLNYGGTPELGLAQGATVDPTGLSLSSSTSYETPGTGYLRPTSQTSPDGSTTANSYYGAADTSVNPCVQNSSAAYQAGMLKTVTNPSPDGGTTPGIAATNIYDDAGNIVATETNSDGWVCKTYDARERLVQDVIPAYNGQAARTVTYNYDVNGNPLVTSTTDSQGTITSTVDLLGRTVSYTDALGNTTATTYDSLGRLSGQTGPAGTQEYDYDTYSRLSSQKLNGTVVATPAYDTYGRLTSVATPTAGSQGETITRNTFGATTGLSYTLGNGSAGPADAVTLSQSGKVVSGTQLGDAESYSYDTAGRLTGASIGSHSYAYNYGAPSGCSGTYNAAAEKSSNRTSQTIDGVTTNYCYNYADQLVSSADADTANPTYDSHGNTTSLGNTSLAYDSSDRNTSITQGNNSTTYARDVQGRVIQRTVNTAGSALPAPWVSADIGSPTVAGSASYSNGTYTVNGAGYDVWQNGNTDDQFHFIYQPLAGDGQIVARVTSQTNTNDWAKAGIVIKASTTSGSEYASIMTTPSHGIRMEYDYTNDLSGPSYTFPNTWLKLVRSGNTITTYSSSDGATWTQVGSTASVSLPTTALVGIYVASVNETTLSTATFDNVTVTQNNTSGLPAGWTNTDIGSPAVAGSTGYNNGTFTVNGAGYDVWQNGNTDDQFQYAYQSLTGDGQIIARVTSQTNTNDWAKAGVVIKASTTSGSNYASIMTTPSHGIRMEYDYTTDIAGSNYTFPDAWLKLVRSGNTITTYDSPDGSTWTQVGSTSAVTLPATALIGVYVSSVNASTLSTATFDNVSVTRSSSASTVYRYGFSGSNSSPTVLTDSAGTVIETYTPLPGGILLTTRPNAAGAAQQTFSLPNIHGDVMATTDGTGTILGTYQYDPFGNPIGIASPGNATGSASYGWAGEHGKLTEIQFTLVSMQMG
ncbi:MAG TPA: PA14 domain-containing protein, partial [Candidatus Saccharimonadales bacterium]|nr:PA14 domain-containing protein [Candidatus Saccharimonadales bacterium]